MHTLPTSLLFFVFLPEMGGPTKCVLEPTSPDPTRAEVFRTMTVEDDRKILFRAREPDTQRRMDESASDMLELACARLGAGDSIEAIEARIEDESLRLALATQGRWNERTRHPEDEGAPLWHEHN